MVLDLMTRMEFLWSNGSDMDVELDLEDHIHYDKDMLSVQSELLKESIEGHSDGSDLLVNDVFLFQNNDHIRDALRELSDLRSQYSHFNDDDCDTEVGEQFDDSDSDKNSVEQLFDAMYGLESADALAYETMFGCICCESCKSNSLKGISKINEALHHFRRQMIEIKENVSQHLCEINSEINATRLDCARRIVDLQIKLNIKNNYVDNLLDLVHLLSVRNDSLSKQVSDMELCFEKVCKENIDYRNRLGFKLKVVLDANDCNRLTNEMKCKGKACKPMKANSNVINVNKTKSSENLNQTIDVTNDVSNCTVNDDNTLTLPKPLPIDASGDKPNDTMDEIIPNCKSLTVNGLNLNSLNSPISTRKKRGISINSPRRYRSDYVINSTINESKDCATKYNSSSNHVNHKLHEDITLIKKNNGDITSGFESILSPIRTYSKIDAHLNKNCRFMFNGYNGGNGYTDIETNIMVNNIYNEYNNFMNQISHYKHEFNTENCSLNDNPLNSTNNLQSFQHNSYQKNLCNNSQLHSLPSSDTSANTSIISFNNEHNGLKLKIKLPKEVEIVKNKRYCKWCKNSFPDMKLKEFKNHLYDECPARDASNRNKIRCTKCSRVFLKTSALMSHLRWKGCGNKVKIKKTV